MNEEDIVQHLLEKHADYTKTDIRGLRPVQLTTSDRIKKWFEDYDPASKHWKHKIDANVVVVVDGAVDSGNYGTVHRGRVYGTPCAIKELKASVAQASIFHEIGVLCDIRHPNILTFLGTCDHPELGHCIITEFIDGGSLGRYIDETATISLGTMLSIALDTARAMAWLHSRKLPILHRDLHTNNILVTRTHPPTCKVCDFGLAQIQGARPRSSMIYQRIRPPESENGTAAYSTYSDVFMYGCVLLEVLTRKKARKEIALTRESFQILIEEYALIVRFSRPARWPIACVTRLLGVPRVPEGFRRHACVAAARGRVAHVQL